MGHIKELGILGMNTTSDQYILPASYAVVAEPFYKGRGNYSVMELENLCEQYKEYCHQQAIIKSELIKEIKSL